MLCVLGEGKVLKPGVNFDEGVIRTYRHKLVILNHKNNKYGNHLEYAAAIFGN